jgi:hypothetical protein
VIACVPARDLQHGDLILIDHPAHTYLAQVTGNRPHGGRQHIDVVTDAGTGRLTTEPDRLYPCDRSPR